MWKTVIVHQEKKRYKFYNLNLSSLFQYLCVTLIIKKFYEFEINILITQINTHSLNFNFKLLLGACVRVSFFSLQTPWWTRMPQHRSIAMFWQQKRSQQWRCLPNWWWSVAAGHSWIETMWTKDSCCQGHSLRQVSGFVFLTSVGGDGVGWDGMGWDVGSARYKPALLPLCPRV